MRYPKFIFSVFFLIWTLSAMADENFKYASFEATKENGEALGLVLNIKNIDGFLSGFRVMKEEILAFKQKREDRAVLISLTVVLYEEDLAQVASYMDKIYSQEKELAPILQNIEFEVAYLSYEEKLLHQVVYTPPKS